MQRLGLLLKDVMPISLDSCKISLYGTYKNQKNFMGMLRMVVMFLSLITCKK